MELSHDAFISYSHAADGQLAPALERGLEKLAKPLLKLRALDVFLDETSLTASPGLWSGIVKHLSGSQWFLLIACPASAASVWCNREILWWLENRSSERMLILLTEGEIVWDSNANDFDWSRTNALSSSLSKRFAGEPLYVDVRWTRNGGDLSLANPRFRDVVVNIAAPLRGMRKDELDSADVRQLRRNRMFVRAGVMAISIAGLIAVWQAVVANQQRKVAESERDRATAAQSEAERQRDAALARLLAIRAETSAPSDLSVLLAVESLRRTRFVETDRLLRRLIQTRAKTHSSMQIPNAKSSDSFSVWTFSPKGTYFVVGGTTNTVTVWESTTLKEVARFHQPYATSATFSPDESQLAVADTSNNSVVLYNLADGSSRTLIQGFGNISSLAFSPDASLLAVGLSTNYGIGKPRNGHVVLDVRQGTEAGAATTGSKTGRVGFSPDGRYLATMQGMQTVLWDAAQGFGASTAKYEGVLQWEFDPATGSLLILARDGRLRVHTLSPVTAPVAWNLNGIDAFAISGDGGRLATVQNRVIEVRGRDGAAISRIPIVSPAPAQIAFIDDARKLLVRGPHAKMFKVHSGREIASVDRQVSAWSPNGRFVATLEKPTGSSPRAQFWEAKGGETVARMRHDGRVCTVSFDREGRRLLTTSHDRTARIWSVPDGRELARVTHHAPVTAAWFAPDGATVVSVGQGEARRWRADDGINVAALKYRPELRPYFGEVGGCERNPATVAAAFVGQDVMLAVASAGEQAEVWSFRAGARLMAVEHLMDEDPLSNRDRLRVAISADGKVLATSNVNKDGPVRLWEVPSGRLIQKLASLESSAVPTMRPSRWREPVSPDGRYVVEVGTFGGDRAPVIREVSADQPFVELVGQEGVNGAAFSPDGRYLATAAADGTVRLLLWKPDDLASEACRRVVRNFSTEEWDTYVGTGKPQKPCPDLPE